MGTPEQEGTRKVQRGPEMSCPLRMPYGTPVSLTDALLSFCFVAAVFLDVQHARHAVEGGRNLYQYKPGRRVLLEQGRRGWCRPFLVDPSLNLGTFGADFGRCRPHTGQTRIRPNSGVCTNLHGPNAFEMFADPSCGSMFSRFLGIARRARC